MYFDYKLLNKNKPIYLGLSGGIDSISGTHFLINKFKHLRFKAIHVNNQLGKFDDNIANNVKAFCNQYKLELKIIDSPSIDSTEANCRIARMKVFHNTNAQIILFHHLSDAVESYLMNCFRGHNDYLPIPLKTKMGKCTLVRPFLLNNTKQGFIDYAKKHGLDDFILEDPLNEKSVRGWMRGELLPVIEKKYDGLEKVVKNIYKRREAK